MRSLQVKMLAGALSAVLAAGALAGCSQEEKEGASASPAASPSAAAEEPTPISIMTVTTATEMIDNTQLQWKEIEKRTNTKLDITFVPSSNYGEKFNVALASGSLPEVALTFGITDANVMNAAMNGAFWDISSYYKNYPQLGQYPQDVWRNTKAADGKNYGIPRSRALIGGPAFIAFRQDWLDKLGLKLPETTDDIYNVLKAFVNNDPDGNGQKDTQGLVMFPSPDGVNMQNFHALLGAFTGVPTGYNYWTVQNDVFKSVLPAPEMKEAILYLRKLYSEGLLHKDFVTMKQQQMRDAGMSGKVGALGEGMAGSWVVTEGLKKVVPQGDFTTLSYVTTASGQKYVSKGNGHNGVYLIRKQGVDEAKLKKILNFFDQLSTEELWEIAQYGIKDVHFVKEGVAYKQTEQAKTDKVNPLFVGQLASRNEAYYYAYGAPNTPKERVEANVKRIDEMTPHAVANPMDGLTVASWTAIQKDYDKRVTDQILKIVLGTDTLENWDAFVAKMMADEKYLKAQSDLAEAYKLKMGK
ncbi:MAG: transporter substrate-binding protein [Paenibacillaceae bacterium]|nr:transporter substrate-binding protein [Paenibacillaceae bacterium]